ncbi:protease [Paenibacillus cisolokensis]|uniref:protease n=1 Tax=Paenibacillus cisolokensis TaxID=1658519 RepID=UPI003D2821F7
MEALFWSCLAGGALYAIVCVVFGDFLSEALDGLLDFLSPEGVPWLEPTTIVGAITVFGGAGLLLDRYSPLGAGAVIAASLLIAVLAGAGVFFLYVKPMENSENSTGYSIRDLTGKLGEVLVPIPSAGYGEVLVSVGAGRANHIAASFDGEPIAGGSRVVVVEVRDGTLYVSRLEM